MCAHTILRNFASEKETKPQKEGQRVKKIQKDNKLNKGAVKQRCRAVPLKMRKEKSYDVNKFRNSAYACNGSSISRLWTYLTEKRSPRQLNKARKVSTLVGWKTFRREQTRFKYGALLSQPDSRALNVYNTPRTQTQIARIPPYNKRQTKIFIKKHKFVAFIFRSFTDFY